MDEPDAARLELARERAVRARLQWHEEPVDAAGHDRVGETAGIVGRVRHPDHRGLRKRVAMLGDQLACLPHRDACDASPPDRVGDRPAVEVGVAARNSELQHIHAPLGVELGQVVSAGGIAQRQVADQRRPAAGERSRKPVLADELQRRVSH